jgi:hypothetical protein
MPEEGCPIVERREASEDPKTYQGERKIKPYLLPGLLDII